MDLPGGAAATWPVPLPQGIVVNGTTRKAYLTTGAGTVRVVGTGDPARVIADVPVGRTPKWPGLDPQTNRIYVPNHEGGSVSVIDGAADRVVATIPIGRGAPVQAIVDAAIGRVYVTSWTTSDIVVIDGPSGAVVGRLPLPGDPVAGAIDPATGRLFVTYNGAGPTGHVAIFDRNGVKVGDQTVSSLTSGIAFNQVTGRLYVVNGYSTPCDRHCRSISVLDPLLDELDVIPLPFTPGPGIAVDETRGRVYVANYYSRVAGDPIVATLIDAAAPVLAPTSAPSAPAGGSPAVWVRGYPEVGPGGCVEYVAQWSDGTFTSTPWDCGPAGPAARGDATADHGYPQVAANGCVEYVTRWSDGTYTWVPFACPPGVAYPKPAA